MEDGIEQYMSLLNDINSIKQKNVNKNINNFNNNNNNDDKNNINKNNINKNNVNIHEPFSWCLKDS
jgi:hypothetical protein